MAVLSFYDPDLEKGYKRFHSQQCGVSDRTFCMLGFMIWTVTFFRIPAAASWHHRALVAAAVGSTLAPFIAGVERWSRHREALVFALRFLRTAALHAQFNPEQTGTAAVKQPSLYNVVLVSRAPQLLLFAIFFRLRFSNHMILQTISLAIGWSLNQRTCSGWQAAGAEAAAPGLLFSNFVLGCNRYIDAGTALERWTRGWSLSLLLGGLQSTALEPAHGCALLLGGLQLIIGFVVPSLMVWHLEQRSRRRYADLCGGAPPEAGSGSGSSSEEGAWRQRVALGCATAAVGASACWQALEAYDRYL